VPERLVARSHQEAYHLWAERFSDPALMANRDRETTRRKIARLVEQLRLEPDSALLDVGPGDGALCDLVADRVARYRGVDPSPAAVAKLGALFAARPNAAFEVGSAERLPYPDGGFDVVVVNSVLHCLPSKDDVARALAELVRVCRPGGQVFVGELPFRSELARGLLPHLARKLRESGPRAFARNLWATYARPVLRGEPIVLYPATNLHVPEDELRAICAALGVGVETRRHRELRRESSTRNDYLLRRAGGADLVPGLPSAPPP
jgi:ubiquinone/menaquinone biosynthesis C-methylase UbiE